MLVRLRASGAATLARSVRSIGAAHGVPVTTLRRHITARRLGKARPKVGRRQWLSVADEEVLVSWIETRGVMNAAPLRLEICQRAAVLAAVRGEQRWPPGVAAGRRWMDGLVRRYRHRIKTTRTRPTSKRLPTRDEWFTFFHSVLVSIPKCVLLLLHIHLIVVV